MWFQHAVPFLLVFTMMSNVIGNSAYNGTSEIEIGNRSFTDVSMGWPNASVSAQSNYCSLTEYGSFTGYVRCGASVHECSCTCPSGYVISGHDRDGSGYMKCTRLCPTGSYLDISDYTNYHCNECLICPVGTYVSSVCGDESQSVCNLCDYGYYKSSENSWNSYSNCDQCVAGTYASVLGSTFCFTCQQGTYSETPGAISSSTCQTCASGSYCSALGLSKVCSTGTYSSSTGLTACSNCREGTYTLIDGGAKSSGACQPCLKGTYSSTLARYPICGPCESGKYASLTGLTTCSACEPGKYNDGNYNSLCNPCMDRTFQNQSGGTTCYTCSKPICQAGSTESFCSKQADAQCSTCTPVANCVFRGSLCTVNNVVSGVPSCSCRAGFEMQQKGNGVYVCFQCPPETFKSVEGTHTCNNWTAPALLYCERNQFVVPGTQTMDRMCINFPSLPENARLVTGQFTWTCNAGFESIQ
jgi:hypothetical protein